MRVLFSDQSIIESVKSNTKGCYYDVRMESKLREGPSCTQKHVTGLPLQSTSNDYCLLKYPTIPDIL